MSRGYDYPGGDSLNVVAWNLTNSGYKSHPVGQLQANELGLCDMGGNVYEYCWDWYSGSGDQRDPRGPASGSSRVVRGCFYNGEVTYFSVYERFLRAPDNAMNTDGFRVARNRQ